MNSVDYELSREIRGYENDKRMTERAVQSEQLKWKEKLMNEMGKDIDDVISGKVKVKLSFREKLHYKIRKIKEFFNGRT